MNVPCPYCSPKNSPLRGEGCCYCDFTGRIPLQEKERVYNTNMSNEPEEGETYPFSSDIDLREIRRAINERLKND